jgi:hypothetical protein
MTNSEMTVAQVADLPLTVVEMHNQVQLIQQVLEAVFIQDVHYGKIPGAGDKPVLLKPGAEKIMATFRFAADPVVEDLSTSDSARYRVTVRLVSPSGRHVGSGVGECSSDEEKYKWRAAVNNEEFDETPADRRRKKWKRGWNNNPDYQQQQVRAEVADRANTVLKMAKKRALVDACLTATAASDVFAQDLEDMPAELRTGDSVGRSTNGPAGNQDKPTSAEGTKIIEALKKSALGGPDKLLEAWGKLSSIDRAQVGSEFGAIKKLADENK